MDDKAFENYQKRMLDAMQNPNRVMIYLQSYLIF